MKRVRLAAAVVLTATMLAGGTVMAGGSPSSTTTAVTASTSSASTETTAVTENWIPRAHGYQAVKQVRFTSDYSDTEKGTVATVYAASTKEEATTVLQDYVDKNAAATATKFGPYKIRMYRKGVSIWDGFGTFKFNIGVGSKYDGKTATVYQIHKDGTVTTTTVTVTGGKVTVSTKDMGTFYVVL